MGAGRFAAGSLRSQSMAMAVTSFALRTGGRHAMKPGGSERTRLVAANAATVGSSPDGQHILFNASGDRDRGFYTVDANGANRAQFTDNPFDEGSTRSSPDGQWIAASACNRSAAQADLYVMHPDGTARIPTALRASGCR
jgi:Tol biopolymer transport system component